VATTGTGTVSGPVTEMATSTDAVPATTTGIETDVATATTVDATAMAAGTTTGTGTGEDTHLDADTTGSDSDPGTGVDTATGTETTATSIDIATGTDSDTATGADATRGARGGDAVAGTDSTPDPGTRIPPRPATGSGRSGLRAHVNVTIGLETLLGLNDNPADLAGHGPITAQTARDLAYHPDSTWRRLITDPTTGYLLNYGRSTYRPPRPRRPHPRPRPHLPHPHL